MANKLKGENSPYLLQHTENPVEWYPWGEEALEKARSENKPIFLSIGYAACHWCHVMAHESFEDPQTAELMNEHFVNIKVDREERPDLDSIYMDAVVAMTGQGGWPLSIFLTPDGKPFFGGTYFPPVRRSNMPSFREVLISVTNAWKENRDQLFTSGEELLQHIKSQTILPGGLQVLNPEILNLVEQALSKNYDWENGGWGKAPKFPQPMAVEFLLRRASTGEQHSLRIALHALKAMARGGMYDVVGGGFARYSTDDYWLTPHFEKMLYDNAQLAQVYLYAHLLTGDPDLLKICEETLDFVIREMRHPEGGFYSSLDADSEGEEGKYYVWTVDEIRQAVGSADDYDFLAAAYRISETGNFEGKNVLQRALSNSELAERFSLPEEAVNDRLKLLHDKLLKARDKRIRPGVDDKVLVFWNALMLAAFAETARYLQRSDYLEIARQNADFLLTALQIDGRLLRSWRDGHARHNAYLEDYASMILGLLALYQSDPNPRWYRSAYKLSQEMIAHYRDPAGGFFDTSDDHERLVTRPKGLQDNATPSGNALASLALLMLSAYSGRGEWRSLAEEMLASIQQAAARYPTAFAKWLTALDFALYPVQEVAIVGDLEDERMQRLVEVLWVEYRPHIVGAVSAHPTPEEVPALLQERPLKHGKATAYVCQNLVCHDPVNDPEELRARLQSSPG
jgi:uncharacterized protein